MEQKLTISEIRLLRSLAAHKTDEELSVMIGKPVALVQMQFSLMANLPKRPGEKVEVVKVPKVRKPKAIKPVKEKPVKSPKSPKKKSISRAERKVIRDHKKAVKEKEIKERHSLNAQQENRALVRKEKIRKSKFATRPLDLTGTHRIQLNAKTVVWVKPGTNIEELKKKLKIK